MNKENKTTVDILLELVLGYRKHTDKMYEWLDNLKKSNQELREALGNPVCVAKKPKPKTNFDRITESVEALAEWLEENVGCEYCPCFENGCKSTPEMTCEQTIKEWLQKECENV